MMTEETNTGLVVHDVTGDDVNGVMAEPEMEIGEAPIYTALPLSGDRATAIETATRVLTLSGAKAVLAETMGLTRAEIEERVSLFNERIADEAHNVSGWVILVAERVGFPGMEPEKFREAQEIIGKTIAVLYVDALSGVSRGKTELHGNPLLSDAYDLSMVCRLLENPKAAGSVPGLDQLTVDLLFGIEVDCADNQEKDEIAVGRRQALAAVKAVIAAVGPDVAAARGDGTNSEVGATGAAETAMGTSEAAAQEKPDTQAETKTEALTKTEAMETIVVAPQLDIRTLLTNRERGSVLAKPVPLRAPKSQVDEIEAELVGEMPNMVEAIEAICGDLRFGAQFGRRYAWARPTLLLGPPGCGKTRFCRRLSEAMGIPLLRINAAGSSNNLDLAGSSSQFQESQPSAVTKMMATSFCANPMVMVDEVCKASHDRRNGSVYDTLVSMLEPESAAAWRDECLGTPVNLRWVNWILTANDLDTIPTPLLDRLRVVDVKPPTGDALDKIVMGFAADTAREYGGDVGSIPVLDVAAMARLRDVFERHGSLRAVQEAWRNEITVLIGGKTVARRSAPEELVIPFGFSRRSGEAYR